MLCTRKEDTSRNAKGWAGKYWERREETTPFFPLLWGWRRRTTRYGAIWAEATVEVQRHEWAKERRETEKGEGGEREWASKNRHEKQKRSRRTRRKQPRSKQREERTFKSLTRSNCQAGFCREKSRSRLKLFARQRSILE